VLPALAPFLREHDSVQIEIHRQLQRPTIHELVAGRIDFAIAQEPAEPPGIVDVRVGTEEFVLVESRAHAGRRDVLLDVSPNDTTTAWFLASQPARMRPRDAWTRSFLHDEQGILLGVELGLGRAVKPRHTIPSTAAVRVDTSFRALSRAVVLQYRHQRFYGRLHQAIASLLESTLRTYLTRHRRAS
jgi:DNA-binding transcriptional LysR family regulator